jgi:hypothetical protein
MLRPGELEAGHTYSYLTKSERQLDIIQMQYILLTTKTVFEEVVMKNGEPRIRRNKRLLVSYFTFDFASPREVLLATYEHNPST